MELPRRQHERDKEFVTNILRQLAFEEEMGGFKHANKIFKYIILVAKDELYGGYNLKI